MKQGSKLRAEKLPEPGSKYWNEVRQEVEPGVDWHPEMKRKQKFER